MDLPPQEPDEFEVWTENWRAWEIFRRCDTQWREACLDYTALEAVMRMMGEPKRKRAQRLDQVRLIERGAREVIAERRKKAQNRLGKR